MNPTNPPSRWKEGDKFSASHLNESVDLVAMSAPLHAGNMEMVQGTRGRGLNQKTTLRPTFVEPIKIISNASSGGAYNARTLTVFLSDKGRTTDLTEDFLGVWSLTDNAIVYCLQDIGTGSHSLPAGTYGFGVVAGFDIVRNKHILLWVGGAGGGDSMGTDTGQVHIMVANNQDGWDYPFAVTTQ